MIFKVILVIDGWGVQCQVALIWMSMDLTDDKSILVQVMTWCCQATSHYLNQCWPRSLSPYGVIRPKWVKKVWSEWNSTGTKSWSNKGMFYYGRYDKMNFCKRAVSKIRKIGHGADVWKLSQCCKQLHSLRLPHPWYLPDTVLLSDFKANALSKIVHVFSQCNFIRNKGPVNILN